MNLKNIFVATALLSSAATMAQRIDGHYEELNFTENVPANLPQLLSEKSITIDPGHGGYGGDDRKTDVEFGLTYWESTGNFATANFLYAQLEALGCDVSITRIKNDIDHKIEISPESDPSIKERVDFAELMDADFFHSVHTNGVANKTSNYHLMLYASLDKNNRSTAQFPIAKDMSNIMSIELPKVVYTVGAPKVYADLVFQPKWSSGYGILNGTSVPAIISEASFHSNPAEGRRLRSKMYQEAMATQMTKSYLKLYGVGNFNYGEVKGVVDHANNEELNNVTVGAYQNNVLVREVATDNGYNGYYFMGWLAPGEYEIKFSRNDAEFKTELVTVNAMEEVLPRLLEPAQVTFKEIKVNDDDTYTFKWNKIDSDITGYKLFYSKRKTLSSWKLVADDAVLTADKTEYTVSKSDIVTTSLPTLYFKMVAINRNDTEVKTGAESRVYSTSNSDAGIKALIVDGFDRLIGANSANKHSLSVIYADALSTVAEIKSVSTVDNTVVIDTDVLLNYDVVYWISGEESSADIPFTDVEQQKISTYLNNGGKFIVSGAEIGYQLVGKSKGVDFFTNYLKAEYKSDGGKSVGTALGIENTIYENYDIAFNNANNWEITSPDGVTAVAGAENLMTYSNGGGENAAVGYKGTFGNGIKEGGVVFYSFPIGSAKLESAKNLVLLSTKYLFNYESILSVESNNTLSTLKTYPNPFVEELYITINNIANTTVNVQVYNAVGLIIKSEKIEVLNSNVIKLYAGNLAKGLYFIKVTNSEGKVGVSKIIKE